MNDQSRVLILPICVNDLPKISQLNDQTRVLQPRVDKHMSSKIAHLCK